MRFLITMVVLLSLSTAAEAQKAYTENQLQLAAQVGAVIAMVKQCGVVPMPTEAVFRAIRGAGLHDTDFTNQTLFRARIEEQAKTVNMIAQIRRNTGAKPDELAADACRLLVQNYGPNGSIRKGLVPQR